MSLFNFTHSQVIYKRAEDYPPFVIHVLTYFLLSLLTNLLGILTISTKLLIYFGIFVLKKIPPYYIITL